MQLHPRCKCIPAEIDTPLRSGCILTLLFRSAVEYASGLRDTETLGKQDPYAIIKCGGQQLTSRTITGEQVTGQTAP